MTENVKILFFITKSEAGGAQTHVADLTAWLVRHGHTVLVMSTPGGLLEDETNRSGGTFVPNPSLGNTANPFRLFSATKALQKIMCDFAPDVLACHSTMAGLIGRFTVRNRVPTVFTAHGWSFTQGAKRYRQLLLPTLERLAARFCDKIICVSENDLRLAVEKKIAPKEKLVVVHNGVEIASSSPTAPPRNDGVVHILFIGRLAQPKQPDLLIRAITTLPDDVRNNIRLTIIGDGPRRKRLQEMVLRNNRFAIANVHFTGALTREQTRDALTSADIFVLPSRYEGLPYSISEAMAAGVPVIASDVGGVREAVENDAGILVPPNDVQALKTALERLMANPNLRKRMGKAGQRKIQNEFSLETMCQKTVQIYLDIAGKND